MPDLGEQLAEGSTRLELASKPGPFSRVVSGGLKLINRVDRVWQLFIAIVVLLLLTAPAIVPGVLSDVIGNLAHTGIFIAFAVLLIASLRASQAEALVASAFQGQEYRMVILAALVGGLAPFCSCEVIPFIAALLAMGTPLSAVMAFWLSSPIMDPPMFLITASALGVEFALAKTIAAVAFGLLGGFTVMLLGQSRLFSDPLREDSPIGCSSCCGQMDAFSGQIDWTFWKVPERLQVFWTTLRENAMFLIKWLALAYLLEVLMIRYLPAHWISNVLGGDGFTPVALAALLGGPAYLNGYAAVPLVQGMLQQGMSDGAAMAFVLAGSVTCIPAAIAVWALVKPRIFFSYLVLGISGSFVAGLIWAWYA